MSKRGAVDTRAISHFPIVDPFVRSSVRFGKESWLASCMREARRKGEGATAQPAIHFLPPLALDPPACPLACLPASSRV